MDSAVELHNGDLVRIGRAQPFVFEKRSLIPLSGNSIIDDAPVDKDMSKSAMFPVLGTKVSHFPVYLFSHLIIYLFICLFIHLSVNLFILIHNHLLNNH
ncbi:unnamed protein product [Haemonchus placei]|uniref:Uncharacterized protein n=1 Tax=Haemonchus placei TaxID=6290 RepID=A0A0N4W069_HAEPC|nr:unnamed protein product [Haemonchus placei]